MKNQNARPLLSLPPRWVFVWLVEFEGEWMVNEEEYLLLAAALACKVSSDGVPFLLLRFLPIQWPSRLLWYGIPIYYSFNYCIIIERDERVGDWMDGWWLVVHCKLIMAIRVHLNYANKRWCLMAISVKSLEFSTSMALLVLRTVPNHNDNTH